MAMKCVCVYVYGDRGEGEGGGGGMVTTEMKACTMTEYFSTPISEGINSINGEIHV